MDSNWYEGERNAMLGIFPTTYVVLRMLLLVRFCFSNGQMKYLFHQVSTLSKKERNMDGAAKAKFNFTAQTPMEVSFLKGEKH